MDGTMKNLVLYVAYALGVLSTFVVLFDYVPRARAAWRRRRRSRGGAFGVVVDRAGRVLGTYLDPFGHPWRAPRAHEPGGPWGRGDEPAWEGFGATEEEARDAANRLRRRHLQLLGLLGEPDEDGEEDFFAVPNPFAPRSE
jgi:hypothetical protein